MSTLVPLESASARREGGTTASFTVADILRARMASRFSRARRRLILIQKTVQKDPRWNDSGVIRTGDTNMQRKVKENGTLFSVGLVWETMKTDTKKTPRERARARVCLEDVKGKRG